jgi:hypothetical protein
MNYPFPLKKIRLNTNNTPLTKLHNGSMTQDVLAGEGHKGQRVLLEQHEHHVFILRDVLDPKTDKRSGELEFLYNIPNADIAYAEPELPNRVEGVEDKPSKPLFPLKK